MSLYNILKPSSQVQNSQGAPLAGGYVFLYEPGTTTFVTAFADSGLVIPLSSPFRLSASGRVNAWITRDVNMFIYDRNGNLVLAELNANPDSNAEDQSGLVPNGSFEIDADVDSTPDGWTRVNSAGSSNGRDNTTSTDGAWSFRFTSSGTGGGSLTTTDFFPVTDLSNLRVAFDVKGSILGPNNRVRVEWYDISFVSISNTDAYNVTNTPLTWTSFSLSVAPPVNARFAKLKLIGIDPSVPFSGSTWYDRINVFYPAVVSGTFDNITISGNSIVSTNTNGAINIIPNGTGNLRLGAGLASFDKYSADAVSAIVSLQKSRNVSDGSQTVVQSGDDLGLVQFTGSDGTAFRVGAQILAEVDGTPGANDMPGRLVFFTTPDGSATPAERLRLTQNGLFQFTEAGSTFAAPLSGTNAMIQMQGTTGAVAAHMFRYSADSNSAQIQFIKSRAATVGGNTIVQSGDTLGLMTFRGADGSGASGVIAATIQVDVDGTPGVADMPGRIRFLTTPDGGASALERLRITNAGQVAVVGGGGTYTTPSTIGGATAYTAILGSRPLNVVDEYSADTLAGNWAFRKSRNATIGVHTIVQSGDTLGSLEFYGSNGTSFDLAAYIVANVDGTPGTSNDMPGRLAFLTSPDGSATPAERMRISANGVITGWSQPAAALETLVPVGAYKAADQNVTSSTTLTTAFTFANLEADTVYQIEGYVQFRSTSATPNVKFAFSNSAAAQASGYSYHWADSAAAVGGDQGGLTSIQTETLGATVTKAFHIKGFIHTNAGAGPFSTDFQFAQNVSDAASTTMQLGSWMRFVKMGIA